ncbi:MAG: DNA alkylation repair protein [Micromonosporaceae bacterium]|nr:DNA alkylation repair protein [Micromonosporaceae bacterium]
MAAYMRGRFDFLGLPTPQRRVLSREVLAGLAAPVEADLRDIAHMCWDLPEREYQYFGCDLLVRCARQLSAAFITDAERLITAKSWWDSVDPLATRVVGSLVSSHPALGEVMDSWIAHENLWLVRAALLHQLNYHEVTDAGRLFDYCRIQSGHPDFFVRKAIGWALRQHGKTNPAAVRRFVRAHRAQLSPLSVREALKHLG